VNLGKDFLNVLTHYMGEGTTERLLA